MLDTPAASPEELAEAVRSGRLCLLPLLRLSPALLATLQTDTRRLVTEHAAHLNVTESGKPLTDAGDWRVYVLYNRSGRIDDMSDDPVATDARRFTGGAYPGFRRLHELFAAGITMFNITCAPPGSRLVEHTDPVMFPAGTFPGALDLGGHNYLLRFHVPLFVTAGSHATFVASRRYFEEGVLYFFNTFVPHSSANEGASDRFHCVIDAWLTAALWRDLFERNASSEALDGFERPGDAERLQMSARTVGSGGHIDNHAE